MSAPDETTRLLNALGHGDKNAADALYPLVYEHLRALAGGYFRRQPQSHTLQPTALVNELFVKLSEGQPIDWTSRAHFLAVAARAMRQILVDHARTKNRDKRGGGRARYTLCEIEPESNNNEPDLLDLHQALEQLAQLDPQQSQLITLRFFGGLTVQEAAEVLEISRSTAEAEWRLARAWLRRQLTAENDGISQAPPDTLS